MENKIAIELTEQEINVILHALSLLPYKDVFSTVDTVMRQGRTALGISSRETDNDD
jgi:hypothetical protein